jgi:hypothetical protein
MIGFGFKVDDRFVSVTPVGVPFGIDVSRTGTVPTTAWRVTGSGCTDVAFFILVY